MVDFYDNIVWFNNSFPGIVKIDFYSYTYNYKFSTSVVNKFTDLVKESFFLSIN